MLTKLVVVTVVAFAPVNLFALKIRCVSHSVQYIKSWHHHNVTLSYDFISPHHGIIKSSSYCYIITSYTSQQCQTSVLESQYLVLSPQRLILRKGVSGRRGNRERCVSRNHPGCSCPPCIIFFIWLSYHHIISYLIILSSSYWYYHMIISISPSYNHGIISSPICLAHRIQFGINPVKPGWKIVSICCHIEIKWI